MADPHVATLDQRHPWGLSGSGPKIEIMPSEFWKQGAKEFCALPEMAAFNGVNAARNIRKLTSDEEAASTPVWPLELCRKFEQYASANLRKFYFLGRYGSQRRSDLASASGITSTLTRRRYSSPRSRPATASGCFCRSGRLRRWLHGSMTASTW
jgi:hypothetical protein